MSAKTGKPSDKELLDFLDRQSNPSSERGWILRQSTTGRGPRLHVVTQEELDRLGIEATIHRTARAAITEIYSATKKS